MNKKTLLFIVTALVTGGITGHVLRPCEREDGGRESGKTAKGADIVPRFGDDRAVLSVGKEARKMSGQEEVPDIDRMIERYARLKGEELLEELKKLEEEMESREGNLNHALYTVLSRYLYLKLGQTCPRQALLQIKDTAREKQARNLILIGWREKNPDALLTYCMEQTETGDPNMQLSFLQSSLMAEKDPEKALNQALTSSSMEKDSIIRQTLAQIMEKNPQDMEKAIKKVQGVFFEDEWLYQAVARDWARADWDSALQWINTLPEDKKNRAMSMAVASLPLEQATLHLSDLNGKAKEAAIYQISGEISYNSPGKALEWLVKNATEEVAVQAVGRMGFNRDLFSPDVSRYVDQMPAGKIKDSILEQMIEALRKPTSENEFCDIEKKDIIDTASRMSSREKRDEVINGLDNKPFRFGSGDTPGVMFGPIGGD